jgi:Nucleoside-diphosphate-sugar epimerases
MKQIPSRILFVYNGAMENTSKPRILIAGATGFIGRRLIHALEGHSIVALQRHQPPTDKLLNMKNVTWRNCDLYSLLQTEQVCVENDIAIYLVHSMMPSARLNQANFQDTDLIMADNFARACKKAGVKQIIYLGGIIPDDPSLSKHLESRLEVERTLGSHGMALTSLRAAMIIGPGGSSFEMMSLLVKRLGVMLTPAWTNNSLQPVDIEDVVAAILEVINNPEKQNQCWDLVGPEKISYKNLMLRTAAIMGKKMIAIPVPFFTPRLSVLWIRFITGMSTHLIKPLVESLKHDMLARPQRILRFKHAAQRTLDESLKTALKAGLSKSVATVHHDIVKKENTMPSNVRSVQRLPLPPGCDAQWVAREYLRWLPEAFSHIVVDSDQEYANFYVFHPKLTVLKLKLSSERSSTDRPLFYIVGGLLAGKKNPVNARLEFREVLDQQYILAAIHNFSPSLPWYVYKYSQAIVHLFVMRRFASHLEKVKNEKLKGDSSSPSLKLQSVSKSDLPERAVSDRPDSLV